MREESRRLSIAEIQIVELKRRLFDAEARIARLELMLSQVQGGTGGGGGTSGMFWCKSPGFAAASGSWSSITPSTGVADVYRSTGGALVSFSASQTINWYYKDASVAGKLVAVSQNTDGTWDAILDSCTAI